MSLRRTGLAAASALALLSAFAAARAQQPAADLAAAERQMRAACVARGEPAATCACGVRIAREELDPRVFLLIPRVEPLLDEPPLVALMGLSAALDGAGLTVEDGFAAYETIKANRERVKRECAAAR